MGKTAMVVAAEMDERDRLERERRIAMYTPEIQAQIDQAKLAAAAHSSGAKERKVPRWDALKDEHRYEDDPGAARVDEIVDEWMPVIDRAVHNSPPPMDDVGEDVKHMLDEKDPHRLILEREKTHGDFREQGRVVQRMKDIVRTGPTWQSLKWHQGEAVDMILHKLGRIVCGDPNFSDHWDDIAGYAVCVSSFLGKEMRYGPSS